MRRAPAAGRKPQRGVHILGDGGGREPADGVKIVRSPRDAAPGATDTAWTTACPRRSKFSDASYSVACNSAKRLADGLTLTSKATTA